MQVQENYRSNVIIKIIIVVGLLIAVTSLYLLLSIKIPEKPLAGQGGGGNADVQIGGDFELIDQDAKIFNSDSLKGKLSLVYFGFTFCPDICPMSMQKLTEVINTLRQYQVDVTFVFVTIDPERDTPEVLKEYLKNFDNKFIGLTGSKEQIQQVADQFKVYYSKAHDQGNYMVDHSSFTYLMDHEGNYLKHFYLDSSSQEIVDFVRVMKQN
jgi:protein SCO1/2